MTRGIFWTPKQKEFIIDCQGDVVVGDHIMFKEEVGNGYRLIAAHVIKDVYTKKNQVHNFILRVIFSKGEDKVLHGIEIKRTGHQIYKYWTRRVRWETESDRLYALDEKHRRGTIARMKKKRRLSKKGVSNVGSDKEA